MSKDIARESILQKFRETGMRYYTTPDGLKANTYVNPGRRSINVAEAKALLDEDTFNKLVKESEPVVVLSVRQMKEGEEDEQRE